jgi:AraC family ethanolamine operon transcriptional activator
MHPSGINHQDVASRVPVRVSRQAQDVFDQASNLPQWQQQYWQLSPGAFAGQTQAVDLDGIQIFREVMNRSVDQLGQAPRGRLVLGIMNSSHGDGYWAGQELRPTALLTLQDGGDLVFRTPIASDMSFITLELSALQTYSMQRDGVDIASHLSRLPPVLSLDDRAVGHFGSLLQLALEHHMESGDVRAMHHLRSDLFSACLQVLNIAPMAPPVGGTQRVHRYLVNTVRETILTNSDDVLTIDDLAAALKVSRRTLHHAFSQVLGINPVTYVRNVRLHMARRALRQGLKTPGMVRDVAANHGFWHLGLFAKHYKTLFGESPSQTPPWMN